MTTLYRYQDDLIGGSGIILREFIVARETPCYYWVQSYYGDCIRKTAKTGKCRFAYPTKEEAWNSYRERKRRHVAHLERQLEAARKRRNITENIPAPDQSIFQRVLTEFMP